MLYPAKETSGSIKELLKAFGGELSQINQEKDGISLLEHPEAPSGSFPRHTSKQGFSVTVEEQLSAYQRSFLKGLDLEAFSAEVFDPRGISTTLECRDGHLVLTGNPLEVPTRAVEVLKHIVKEKAIRINGSNQAATKGREWKDLLQKVKKEFNADRKKVQTYISGNQDDSNFMVVLVGFEDEVQITNSMIRDYLHKKTRAKRTLEFRQTHLVEAGTGLLHVLDWDTSSGARVIVQVVGPSKLEVILVGTREDIQRAQELIKTCLKSLVKKSIILEEPWTKEYFGDQKTKRALEEYCKTYRCHITLTIKNAGEIQVTGRPSDVEKALTAISHGFHSAKVQKCVCDPQIALLSLKQLASIQKDLNLRLTHNAQTVTIEGLPREVQKAQKRMEELLKDMAAAEPEGLIPDITDASTRSAKAESSTGTFQQILLDTMFHSSSDNMPLRDTFRSLWTASRQFVCPEPGCSRSFDSQRGLSLHHTLIHTAEGRATCPKCGKESTKSGITRHLPYCTGWSSRLLAGPRTAFPDINQLFRDKRVADPPTYQPSEWLKPRTEVRAPQVFQPKPWTPSSSFTCGTCSRSFDSQRGLSLHFTLMHTAAGRATCPSCGKESTKSGITRHKCKGW
ncbi:uncharacterized protein LOC136759419 [Amia ocellicauda]|uniref:uncharacterized protein LOC136759419 n=1 Tax=Amia ocellicauda TaxID=2972642 RepID=UPI0034643DB0